MSVSHEPLLGEEMQGARSGSALALQRVLARLRGAWKPGVWMLWLHRWATFTLGIILLVTTFSGVVALFAFDLNRLTHPALYHVTSSATPITLDAARAAMNKALTTDPALKDLHAVDLVMRPGDSYQFYLYDKDDEYNSLSFIDPGNGAYLGHYNTDKTIWGWFEELHYDLFADDVTFTYPGWVPQWLQTFIGPNLAELILKNVALALFILVLTGAYVWWPGIRKLVFGFRVRPGVKGYAWHYDWHKVLGIVSLPFLFMWAVTGLNFYEPYATGIKAVWQTVTWSASPPDEPEDLESTPTGRAMISADLAREKALAVVPDGKFISISYPSTITGTLSIWMAQGMDPYAHGEWPGQVNLTLDAYSGKLLDNSATRDTSLAAYIYEWWFYTIHAGVSVSWPVRIIWAIFGLMPTFLAFTGVMQWWLKRKKRKERSARRRSLAAGPPLERRLPS